MAYSSTFFIEQLSVRSTNVSEFSKLTFFFGAAVFFVVVVVFFVFFVLFFFFGL